MINWLGTALPGGRRFDLGTDIAGCVEFRPHGPDTPWISARIAAHRPVTGGVDEGWVGLDGGGLVGVWLEGRPSPIW